MKEETAVSTTQVKEKAKSAGSLRDDFQFNREVGRVGVLLFMALGLVIGALSLLAFVRGLFIYLT